MNSEPAVYKFKKIWLRSKLSLVDFHVHDICRISSFYENKTQHQAWLSTKTNQGRIYFHRALILSWAYDLAAVQSSDTIAVVRVESKIGS